MKFKNKFKIDGALRSTSLVIVFLLIPSNAYSGDSEAIVNDSVVKDAEPSGVKNLSVAEKTQFTVKKDIEKAAKANKEEKVVKKGSKVAFHIVMQLEDGKKVFDSATDGRPWTGVVGDGSILTGINDGLYGMAEGGKRSLWIPPHQAYGANGVAPSIPANAKLYAEITLISIDAEQP